MEPGQTSRSSAAASARAPRRSLRRGCGRRVILTEETHWLGGQLTNQAVPPDEHPWIEDFGATASYRALRAASATTTARTCR